MKFEPLPLGTILGIDRMLRAGVRRSVVCIPRERAAEVLGRAPDIEQPNLVSWGNLSRTSITDLLTEAAEPSGREDVLEEVCSLFQDEGQLQWCLYYRWSKDGD